MCCIIIRMWSAFLSMPRKASGRKRWWRCMGTVRRLRKRALQNRMPQGAHIIKAFPGRSGQSTRLWAVHWRIGGRGGSSRHDLQLYQTGGFCPLIFHLYKGLSIFSRINWQIIFSVPVSSVPVLQRLTMMMLSLNVSDSNFGQELLKQMHKPQNDSCTRKWRRPCYLVSIRSLQV